ncbi:hypothetical protein D3C71_1502490 [compost metagenome]
MVLAADARLLVATKRGVRRVGVVAVGPHAPGLDAAAHAVQQRGVAAPHPGTEPVEGVVGDLQRFFFGLEGGHRHHRPEDLLLEHAHLVVALEHRGLHVEAAGQLAIEGGLLTADQDLGPFLPADVEVGQDLLQLLGGGLRADHGVGIERIALLDRCHALERTLHECVVDRLLDQRARGTGAHLALVEGEQHEAFHRLVQEVIVVRHHVGEEDIG